MAALQCMVLKFPKLNIRFCAACFETIVQILSEIFVIFLRGSQICLMGLFIINKSKQIFKTDVCK